MIKSSSKMRWNVEQRIEFIDFRLLWEGRINRQGLMEYFGVSTPQASADIKRYMEAAPENTVYDKSLKAYVATDSFEPRFASNDPDQYLTQLKTAGDGLAQRNEIWASKTPSFGILPMLHRKIDPVVFKSVLRAVNEGSAIQLNYQSMSNKDLMWRWVTPHAFAFDGLRWHVRVCCHIDRTFKDFILSRIMDIGETHPSPIDPQWDREWHEIVSARLVANPNEGDNLKTAVEKDYCMENGELLYDLRGALVYYLKKSLGIFQDKEGVSVLEQPVFFANREEIDEQCRTLRQQSKKFIEKLQLVNE